MTHPPQRLVDAAKTVSDLKSRTGEPGTCDAELDAEIAGFHGVRAKMLAGLRQLDSQPGPCLGPAAADRALGHS